MPTLRGLAPACLRVCFLYFHCLRFLFSEIGLLLFLWVLQEEDNSVSASLGKNPTSNMIENLYSYYIFMVADYRSAKSWSWSFSRYSIWLICPSVSVDCVPWRRLEIQEQVCISIHRYICTHGYLHRRAGHLFSYINGRFDANFHSLSYSWESLFVTSCSF